jgi:hypothetical protein
LISRWNLPFRKTYCLSLSRRGGQGVCWWNAVPGQAFGGCGRSAALCYSVCIMAKSACPISKSHFIEKAEPIKLVINGQELVADKREFSTGSFGWFFNGKISVAVDGKPVSVQVGLNLTVVGSKDAER